MGFDDLSLTDTSGDGISHQAEIFQQGKVSNVVDFADLFNLVAAQIQVHQRVQLGQPFEQSNPVLGQIQADQIAQLQVPIDALAYPVASQTQRLQIVQRAQVGNALDLILVQHQVFEIRKQSDRKVDFRQLIFLENGVPQIAPLLRPVQLGDGVFVDVVAQRDLADVFDFTFVHLDADQALAEATCKNGKD